MTVETNRQDQANVSLTVDGRPMPFKFQKRSGGKVGGEGSKTPPGGMEPKVAHGGIVDIEDLTLEWEIVPARDDAIIKWLKSRVMKARASANEALLDTEGDVLDPSINRWSGILASLDTGNYDGTSADVRLGILTVECDGNPG